jgi:hypothetical protein
MRTIDVYVAGMKAGSAAADPVEDAKVGSGTHS